MKQLTLIDKAYLLKRTQLFKAIDLDELLFVADKLNQTFFDAEQLIFSEGDKALRMYFLAQGSVQLISDNQKNLTTLEAVDFFGDEALFNDQQRAYSASSQTPCVLLSISRTNLMAIISKCPTVAIGLLQVYATALPLRPRPDRK